MNILLLIFGGGAEQNGKEPGQQTNQRQCKDLGDAPPKSDLVRLAADHESGVGNWSSALADCTVDESTPAGTAGVDGA